MQFSNGIQMYLWQYYIKRKRVIKISIKQIKIDQSYDNNAFMRWPFINYPVLKNIHYYSISATWSHSHIIAYCCSQKMIHFILLILIDYWKKKIKTAALFSVTYRIYSSKPNNHVNCIGIFVIIYIWINHEILKRKLTFPEISKWKKIK